MPQPDICQQFLISFWCAPPGEETNLQRYREIAECGFNVVLPPCGAWSVELNRQILHLCQQTGLKAIVGDGRVMAKQPNDPDFARNLDAVIADYAHHPALAGYFLVDEPSASAFPLLGSVNRYFLQKDPKHLPYINLFPNYANEQQLGTESYDEHIARYIREVQPALVSWDHYALLENGERDIYFENLEIVRRHCLQANLPFVQIVLTVPHGPYRDPDEVDLRWQAYTTLAYGAKGILWFTYWTPPFDPQWRFRNAIINEKGVPSTKYTILKDLHGRIRNLARTQMRLRSAGVYHTPPLPKGTVALDSRSPITECDAEDTLLGWLRDGQRRDYLWVVNRSFRQSRRVLLRLRASVSEVGEVNQIDGLVQPVSYDASSRRLPIALLPGEGKLFVLA
ncbi:MAG: hypothetical protein KatS3mg023_2690 [Armatimonadota bacterium]|nr:MAG: hypothetical protein KatS3mg023_2690 [Armatimonadota bacterium]